MNKEEEVKEQIGKITSAIQENYPELTQYLNDMPENGTLETLSEYYESLLTKFRKHISEHQLQNPNRKYKDHHL